MARLLYIKASPRGDRSYSVSVADAFIAAYKARNAADEVVVLDVSRGLVVYGPDGRLRATVPVRGLDPHHVRGVLYAHPRGGVVVGARPAAADRAPRQDPLRTSTALGMTESWAWSARTGTRSNASFNMEPSATSPGTPGRFAKTTTGAEAGSPCPSGRVSTASM